MVKGVYCSISLSLTTLEPLRSLYLDYVSAVTTEEFKEAFEAFGLLCGFLEESNSFYWVKPPFSPNPGPKE